MVSPSLQGFKWLLNKLMEKEFAEAYTKYVETIPGPEGPKTEIGWRPWGCYRELLCLPSLPLCSWSPSDRISSTARNHSKSKPVNKYSVRCLHISAHSRNHCSLTVNILERVLINDPIHISEIIQEKYYLLQDNTHKCSWIIKTAQGT